MAEIDVRRTDKVLERTGFRLSWGAIFAGFIVATMAQIILALIGVAVGFTTWDVGDPARDLGMGLGIWMAISSLVALFLGGVTTGRLAGVLTRGDGAMHGIVMWGVATLVNLWLLASGAGFLLGGAFDIVGRTVSATAQAVAGGAAQAGRAAIGATGDLDLGQIQQEIETALQQTGQPALSGDTAQAELEAIGQQATSSDVSTAELAREIQQTIVSRAGAVDREAVINVIVARTDMQRSEAEQLTTRIEGLAGDVRSQVSSAADTVGARAEDAASAATGYLGSAAWWTLLALALGAGAAAVGSSITARD